MERAAGCALIIIKSVFCADRLKNQEVAISDPGAETAAITVRE